MVDKLLLGRKLADMDDHLKKIREISTISIAAYRRDWKTQRAVERTLQILVESAVNRSPCSLPDSRRRQKILYSRL